MSEPFEQLAGLDRLVHDPSRLAILTALSACGDADFVFLQRLTGMTGGNLSSHLTKLETAGLVTVRKEVSGRVVRTRVALTGLGRTRIAEHWQILDQLRSTTVDWPTPDAGG